MARFSDRKKFDKENLKEERREPGCYLYLDSRGNPIYIGVSHKVRHRLKAAFYGRSDYEQVKKKKQLRDRIVYYKTMYTPIDRARKHEHNMKGDMRFNEN